MKMQLPDDVQRILQTLRGAGHTAYAVGGCVRDTLMGRKPNDWDVCSSARPEEILLAFSGQRLIGTGLKHGTVTLLLHGAPYEITTYRVDGAYTDHRRPDEVTFVDELPLDLARRDFTVNAMAADERGIVDLYGGQQDISRRIIRCVGIPTERFQEDALRILRAMRFASALDFDIDSETAVAMTRLRDSLSAVSAERIYQEIRKCSIGAGAERIFSAFPEILHIILPEAGDPAGIDRLMPEPPLRLAYLLRGAGQEQAERAMRRLKADNDACGRVRAALAGVALPMPETGAGARRLLAAAGETGARDACAIRIAQGLPGSDSAAREVEEAIARGDCCRVKDLRITGADLSAIGIPKGPGMGKMLEYLLSQVIEGTLPNDRERLLACAAEKSEGKS